ncbi:hypothetical protein [Runella salmonicolor]|uniref:DM13 domain-containing protein n=1 Tax=Runella salmonicolor TaxID=2950278 RepID=A0ABT1G1D9_9BACT|nr:hypothetical protein [Runella salmonicolor]MCP1386537.1 hypothetical protein [Runella salmonicolor]
MTTTFTNGDTTQARRAPIQLTILGETSFVDFDMPQIGDYWIVIGTSGKAYHIGRKDDNIASFNQTFTQIPLPAGADVNTFKYVAVWCAKARTSTYLKGNDGKIYFTGDAHQSMATGIPEFYFTLTGEAGLTYPNGTPPATVPMGTAVPVLVPFPAGEDIVKIDYVGGGNYYNTLALSASGKGYGAGLWRDVNGLKDYKYTAFALKQPPIPNTEVGSFFYSVNGDSLFVLKRFVELALPPGATKIIDVAVWGHSSTSSIFHGSLVVGDNNKTYWSGRNSYAYDQGTDLPNFIEYGGENISMGTVAGECRSVDKYWIDSPYAWVVEAINFQGASKIYRMFNESSYEGGYDQAFIISKSGKGYFQGEGLANSGLGKINPGTGSIFNLRFPTPIANELLDNCNPSPGTGGLGATDTTPAVGTIDCSKTQIAPAPVAGTPSQTTLMVTINVTTAGTFTPITVSGSGMSLGNGITSVSTTTTGVQTFYIPLQYDGSALTNAFQFTVGSAGSCTADLTTKPNKQVTNVWSLTNCSAITPGVLSK